MNIKEDDLPEINKLRRRNEYIYDDATTYLLGYALKKPLKESPFICYLNYWQCKDGYWTYNHMSLQIEDCGDCFTYLYPNNAYKFELDHSICQISPWSHQKSKKINIYIYICCYLV